MADFFLELYSEEIPARMQAQAISDLKRLFLKRLADAGLTRSHESETYCLLTDEKLVETFCTPRRMALSIRGLPDQQPDIRKEHKGPRVDAPPQALEGFMRARGLGDLSMAQRRKSKKGAFYVVVEDSPGRATADILPEVILAVLADFPWPKAMKWGRSAVRWVRPLHGIVALWDGQVLEGLFDPDGHAVAFGHQTYGLRFPRAGQITPDVIAVQGVEDYRAKMAAAGIVLEATEREKLIKTEADKLCADAGLSLKDDPALLREVAGLVECPVVMMGAIEPQFMDLPDEVLSTSMKAHQKYFSTVDASGKLAPRFVFVANLRPTDGGQAVIAGNERVLSSRLSDARFFWDQDRAQTLESRKVALESVVFQKQLGTMAEKVGRMVELAEVIALIFKGATYSEAETWVKLKFDPVDLTRRTEGSCKDDLVEQHTRRAAALCKVDLTSGMVGEFPELQGIMGGYYARHDGEDPAVVEAIASHYTPAGLSGACPSAPVAVVVALADRLDSLVGFFGTGQRPTGSKDSFALRRAALGVVRLVTDNTLRLDLRGLFAVAYQQYPAETLTRNAADTVDDLMTFFADRWRERQKDTPPIEVDCDDGHRRAANIGKMLSAVRVDGDLVRVQARFEAVRDFLGTTDGLSFLYIYRRSMNIVQAAEQKDKTRYREGVVQCDLLVEKPEKDLYQTMQAVVQEAESHIATENFVDALRAFILLRPVLSDFFEQVMVNVDNPEVRANRLALLAMVAQTTAQIADFSVIGLDLKVSAEDTLGAKG